MLWMRTDLILTHSFCSDPPVCETGQLIQAPGEQ